MQRQQQQQQQQQQRKKKKVKSYRNSYSKWLYSETQY